jgi:S-adenosyl-L-methionine hydrolase (adenosine-forming)
MIVTLTTDFGASSPYVAAMKGVLLSINPEQTIIDLTHQIPPQDIQAGALALGDTALYFPRETIHIAVVDPGVGTSRAIIYAEIAGHRFICPDNGLLTRLAERHLPTKIIRIDEKQYYRQPMSATFHGLGPTLTELQMLPLPGAERMANRIQGQVVTIDSFGNLVTNITREMLAGAPTDESVTVRCDEHETQGIFSAYAEQPPMTLVALIGSNDALEIAIVDDSAKIMLGVGVGAPVEVSW